MGRQCARPRAPLPALSAAGRFSEGGSQRTRQPSSPAFRRITRFTARKTSHASQKPKNFVKFSRAGPLSPKGATVDYVPMPRGRSGSGRACCASRRPTNPSESGAPEPVRQESPCRRPHHLTRTPTSLSSTTPRSTSSCCWPCFSITATTTAAASTIHAGSSPCSRKSCPT
ncbi:hypothetical protein D3C84_785770 [compost metagenome]